MADYELKLTGNAKKDDRLLNIKKTYDLIVSRSDISAEEISSLLNTSDVSVYGYIKFLRDNNIIDVSERIRDTGMRVVGFNRIPLLNLIVVPYGGPVLREIICSECGKLSPAKSNNAKYQDICSECTRNKFMSPVMVTCTYCGIVLEKAKSYTKKHKRCCFDCSQKLTRTSSITKSECLNCNKKISSNVVSGLCGSCSNKKRRSGFRNSKRGQFPKPIRDMFEYKCAICGYDKVVHFHHIIERSEGGLDTVDNCIPLCPNHHEEYHYGFLTKDKVVEHRTKIVLICNP